MAHILFILGSYYPNYSANGLCCKNLADELINRGHEVTFVASSYLEHKNTEVVDGSKIVRVKPRLIQRVLWLCEKKPDSRANNTIKQIAILLNRIKLLLLSPLWPLASPAYRKRLADAAEFVQGQSNIDVVIGVNTPIEALLAGKDLKQRHPGVIFLAYYLDALAGGWGPRLWSEAKAEAHARRYEGEVNGAADIVVSLDSSKPYHDMHPFGIPIDEKRIFLDIPMMLDYELDESSLQDMENPYVLFAGGISYPKRNPEPLLEALAPICASRGIDIVFAGTCNKPEVLEKFNKRFGGHIKYLGQVDHDLVINLERGAICLINIGSTNPNTIPCKIFEYMGMNKPIISTYSIQDEPSIPYLMRYGNFHLFNELNVDASAVELATYIDNLGNCQAESIDRKAVFFKNRPKAFVDTLEAAIGVPR